MAKEKIEVGEIRPIHTITGYYVCKKTAAKPEDAEWTPVEKQSEAEILSCLYKLQVKKKGAAKAAPKPAEEITDQDL